MIEHTLTLNYQLSPGWMAPYVEALQRGQAASLHCSHCNRVSFPPVRTCSCGHEADSWRVFSGKARIIHVCDGLDGQFALAQFEGVTTSSVVRLQGFDAAALDVAQCNDPLAGELLPLESDIPALILQPAGSASRDA